MEHSSLIEKAFHLYEISKADSALWPVLVRNLIAKSWPVTDTKHYVGKVREFLILEGWESWLLLSEVTDRYLDKEEFSALRGTGWSKRRCGFHPEKLLQCTTHFAKLYLQFIAICNAASDRSHTSIGVARYQRTGNYQSFLKSR